MLEQYPGQKTAYQTSCDNPVRETIAMYLKSGHRCLTAGVFTLVELLNAGLGFWVEKVKGT
jgi:hypothetical protein